MALNYIRKGMYVRHFFDDGRGGSYVYGVAVTNGAKRPRIRWENGNEQVVPIHTLEMVTGNIPEDALNRLRLRPVSASDITDEQIRTLWRAGAIDSATRNRAIRTYRGGMGESLRQEVRAHCAKIWNARQGK